MMIICSPLSINLLDGGVRGQVSGNFRSCLFLIALIRLTMIYLFMLLAEHYLDRRQAPA